MFPGVRVFITSHFIGSVISEEWGSKWNWNLNVRVSIRVVGAQSELRFIPSNSQLQFKPFNAVHSIAFGAFPPWQT
jgi:hypothetical protein